MAKNSITDYDNTAANNTDIQSVDIDEGCAPSGINNAIRELMADLADVNDGTVPLASPDINGGTIDGVTIGGTTAGAGTFTGLTANGSSQFGNLYTGTGTAFVVGQTDVYTTSTNPLGVGTAGSADFKFYTASAERMRIDSSGNVGIGTSSPTGVPTTTLHINGTTNAGIHMTDSGSGATDSDGVYLSMDSPNLYIQNKEAGFTSFETNATERMRIDSSGNLLVGTTDTTPYNNTTGGGFVVAPSGLTSIARETTSSNQAVLHLNNTGVNGIIAEFAKDGTSVGSIGVAGSRPYIASSSTSIASGLRFTDDNGLGIIQPCTYEGVNKDNTISLGFSGGRFKDLYLSGGAYLGGTGAANHLDDYEEGTWTPVLRDNSSTGTIIGSSGITAYYVKVGRFVHLNFIIGRSDAASLSGNLYLTGLPYTPISVPCTAGGAWFDNTGTDYRTFFYIPGGQPYALFATTGSTSGYITSNQLQNGRPIYASLTYQTT